MDCQLIEHELGNGRSKYSCPNCRMVHEARSGQAHAKRTCGENKPKPRPPCVHLGDETRLVLCPTCQGETWLKVFACEKFCETVIDKEVAGLKRCRGCGEYRAQTTA